MRIMNALRDPAVQANVLEAVRAVVRRKDSPFGSRTSSLERLISQLQSPPMCLYEDGSFEVIAPAVGLNRMLSIQWTDLVVNLVARRGCRDLNAGRIIWSNQAVAGEAIGRLENDAGIAAQMQPVTR